MSNDRLNLTEYDFRISDEGSLVLLYPENDAAREWVDEHLYGDGGAPVQWWGGAVVVEHRLALAIAEGIAEEGLTIGPA